ncbi:hypothetical protein SpCBS45565_g01126 [Spizellomyces sp. 'palustris']|nr:hypothetical protein SpCBS45565_g01126 [Spizellomyces sp. 'palustris']
MSLPLNAPPQTTSQFTTRTQLKAYRDFTDLIKKEPGLFDTWPEFDDADVRKSVTRADATASESNFKSGGKGSNPPPNMVHPAPLTYKRVQDRKTRQGRLLLVSLLENFCTLYDESPERNRRLFYVICKQLHSMGVIDSEDFLEELHAVRGSYKRAFRDLVVRAMEAIREQDDHRVLDFTPPSPEPDVLRSSIVEHRSSQYRPGSSEALSRSTSFISSRLARTGETFASAWDMRSSRYSEDFNELHVLGKGAFGQVWKVRNRLDSVEYAVKKIPLKMGMGNLERILREVKFHARLSHSNVVRYFSAWVEDMPAGCRSSNRGTSPSIIKDDEGDYLHTTTEAAPNCHQKSNHGPRWERGRITEVATDMEDAGTDEEFDDGMEDSVDLVFAEDDTAEKSATRHDEQIVPRYSQRQRPRRTLPSPEPDPSDEESTPKGFFQTNSAFYANIDEPESSDDDEGADGALYMRDSQVAASTNVPQPVAHPTLPSQSSLPDDVELTLFIQMELCGQTLREYLRERNRCVSEGSTGVSVYECRRIFRDLVEGLVYLHGFGIIHRDVKPKNVYWKPDDDRTGKGSWKIGDFGLVTATDLENGDLVEVDAHECENGAVDEPECEKGPGATPVHAESGTRKFGRLGNQKPRRQSKTQSESDRTAGVGTVTYASPEQLRPSLSTPYTPASDIYSLGIILFELLHPFATNMERARSLQALREGAMPEKFIEEYPEEAGWIFCMMRMDPTSRPGAGEILEWIDEEAYLGRRRSRATYRSQSKLSLLGSGLVSVDGALDCDSDTSSSPSQSSPSSSLGAEVPVTPNVSPSKPSVLPEAMSDNLVSQNEILKARVEELERRLRDMGVAF